MLEILGCKEIGSDEFKKTTVGEVEAYGEGVRQGAGRLWVRTAGDRTGRSAAPPVDTERLCGWQPVGDSRW